MLHLRLKKGGIAVKIIFTVKFYISNIYPDYEEACGSRCT